MSGNDKEIGRTIAELRGEKTQQAVSVEMRNKGWKWSQATVWSVEKGERPLRLREAADLADVLGTTMNRFFSDSVSVKVEDDLRETVLNQNKDFDGLVSSVEGFLAQQDHLRSLMRDHRIQGNESVKYWRDLADKALERTPESAVQKGRVEYKRFLQGEDQAAEILQEYGSFSAYQDAIDADNGEHSEEA